MTRDEEKQLVDSVLRGDATARTTLYTNYTQAVYNKIINFLGAQGRLRLFSQERDEKGNPLERRLKKGEQGSFKPTGRSGEIFQEFFLSLFENDCRRLRQWKREARLIWYLKLCLENDLRDDRRKMGEQERTTERFAPEDNDEDKGGIKESDIKDKSTDPESYPDIIKIRRAMDKTRNSLSERDRKIIDWMFFPSLPADTGPMTAEKNREKLEHLEKQESEGALKAGAKQTTAPEMAESLGITTNNFYKACHDARKRYVEMLKKEDPFIVSDFFGYEAEEPESDDREPAPGEERKLTGLEDDVDE